MVLAKHLSSTLDKRHLNPKNSQNEEAPHDHPSASKHPLSQPINGYWDYSRIHHASTSPKTPLRRRNEGGRATCPLCAACGWVTSSGTGLWGYPSTPHFC